MKKGINKFNFRAFIFIVFLVLFGFLLTSCQKNYPAKNLTKTQTCTACGMIILNYPGPHAQIAWKNKNYTYYGNIIEALPTLFQKSEKQRVGQVWVQDFSGKKWGSYSNSWIKAEKAFYVINGKRLTSMGIGYISFSKKQDAITFANLYEGQVLTYNQLTPAVLKKSEMLMRSNPTMYMPKGMKMSMKKMEMGKKMAMGNN